MDGKCLISSLHERVEKQPWSLCALCFLCESLAIRSGIADLRISHDDPNKNTRKPPAFPWNKRLAELASAYLRLSSVFARFIFSLARFAPFFADRQHVRTDLDSKIQKSNLRSDGQWSICFIQRVAAVTR
jgi:hypothetical protein